MRADLEIEDPLSGHPRYSTQRYLSEGSFGFVVLATENASGKPVAIKFLKRLEDRMTKNVERELMNHSRLIHPHIVRFYECFLTDKHLAIVMEYAAGGSLYSHVTANLGLGEDTSRFLFQQLILALDYCHKMNISNRDIKLENTLLESVESGRNPLIKICDFGYSIDDQSSLPKTKVGTPGYTAPEVLTSARYDAKLADIWSAGVMLYTMLCCSYPFEKKEDDPQDVRTQTKVMQRIMKADYEWPSSKKVSKECKDLLSKILVADPKRRIAIAEIQKHPWYQKALPKGLQLDTYNLHYVELSRAAASSTDLAAAIKKVMQEARGETETPMSTSGADSHMLHAYGSLEEDEDFPSMY
ncbi:g12364 [Coccomyxa viridis]|uniref:G12364 protein n=1 Tax=Coccomyxa viridis TaxID=1274662 RepID=A0ABP1GB82_9CHLO